MDASNRTKKAVSALLLLGASLIWGVSFVAQRVGMDHVGPFTFIAVRSLLASLGLAVCSFVMDRLSLGPKGVDLKRTRKAGVILGAILFVGSNLQQIGILYTTVGKAGFITSLYIVLVPVFGLALKKRVHPAIWLCVLLAACGLYLLSVTDGFVIGVGDFLVLLCAVFYAFHILAIDRFAGSVDVVRMSCIQFVVVGLLSAIPALIWEAPTIEAIGGAWLPLAYAGILSGCCSYTMQMFAQRNLEPTAASLLLSPEAVFSALAGWLILGQTLTPRELLGCLMVFAAVLCSQLPWHALAVLKRFGAPRK